MEMTNTNSLIIFEGDVAHVVIHDDIVEMTPRNGRLNKEYFLRKKINDLILGRELLAGKLDGRVHIPKVIEMPVAPQHKAIIERVRGITLQSSINSSDSDEAFFRFTTKEKIELCLLYLKMLEIFNNSDKHNSILDHKRDGIFLSYYNGVVSFSIVDIGEMKENPNSDEAWALEKMTKSGLREVLASFFTRGLDGRESCIPRGIKEVFDNIDNYASSTDVVGDIHKAIEGSTGEAIISIAEKNRKKALKATLSRE